MFPDQLSLAPARLFDPGREVPDPYYGGAEGFELVADLIEDGCQGLLTHIETQLT